MTLDPKVVNPLAVVVGKIPVSDAPTDQEFRLAARQMMTALGIGFEGDSVVFKPNVTIGERFNSSRTGPKGSAGSTGCVADSS